MLLNELFEVSLGSYRNKASMSRGQAQMGAMFGRDAEQRAQDLATYKKRDAGIKRADARIEKSRQADAARRLAADVAALPDLEAKYQEMVAKYKSLGGSDWQYADREQNLTDREREARSMEGPMNNLWRQIQAAKKSQGVAEGLADTQQKIVDTINKLEDRLKHAKSDEQWDRISARIERLRAGLNRSKQGVAEMDSQGYTGTRDHKRTSKYGSRDDYELGGPETTLGTDSIAKPKDVAKKGADALNRAMRGAHPGYSKHEKKLISKMSNAEKVDKGWRNPNTPNK